MEILFITSSRIGDAVLSTGLLDHLQQTHPQARFTIACGPAAAGVFARMPGRARTLVLRKRSFARHWLGLWARTVTRRWDLVVDLRGSGFAWTVLAGQRAVKRGGRQPGHRLLHIAATLGVTPAPRPIAWYAQEDLDRVAPLLPRAPFLVLGPTAGWAPRMWPTERFVALAQKLTAPEGPLPFAPILILAGPGPEEARMAAPLIAALPEARALLGTLTLPEVSALLAQASLYVGNDSGLMHLAAAAGAPTLGLFGPSMVGEYAPIGPRARAVVAQGTAGHAPMRGLSVAAALGAARGLLALQEAA